MLPCPGQVPRQSFIRVSYNLSKIFNTKRSAKTVIANLNLANQPFRNRTLPWAITALTVCASLAALVLVTLESGQTNKEISAVERELGESNRQTQSLREQAARMNQELSPDQAETLKAAHLLVDRKRFSWSRLLADLEAAVPANVRVSRIRVREVRHDNGQTRGELELTVVGRTPSEVVGMMTEMNRTGIFVADPVAEQTRTDRSETGTELTLRVNYTPRAVVPPVATDTANVASSAATSTSNGGTQ